MQFLISVIDDGVGLATPGEMEAISAFNVRMQEAGQRVFAGGLADPAQSTVIDNRGGKGQRTDGPHLATDEPVAGFWIIEVPDRETALALAVEGSKVCNRKVELRAFLE